MGLRRQPSGAQGLGRQAISCARPEPSQAFHEPMSTGGLVGQVLKGVGPGPAAEMLERRR